MLGGGGVSQNRNLRQKKSNKKIPKSLVEVYFGHKQISYIQNNIFFSENFRRSLKYFEAM